MNLPSFKAEASLYRTNKQYRALSSDFAGAASNAPVVPAIAATALMATNTGGGAGCGSECQSTNGDQKCCCAVGERCNSGATFCRCEDAHGVASDGGVITISPGLPAQLAPPAAFAGVARAMMRPVGGAGGRGGYINCCCGSGEDRQCSYVWCSDTSNPGCSCSGRTPVASCGIPTAGQFGGHWVYYAPLYEGLA